MNRYSALVLLSLAFLSTVNAQTHHRQKEFNLNKFHLAIQGYDPVAYFKQGKAVKGTKEQALTHNGATYYFTSAQNKATFQTSPEHYEPKYGGWCAYAMGATGEKVDVDPETFKIVDGKLYLFYNSFFNNTLKLWNKDEKNLHTKAEVNWKKRNP